MTTPIKFWSILPTAFIHKEEFHISDTQLVLAHLIKENKEYLENCKKWQTMGNKVVIDNSYYELKRNMNNQEYFDLNNLIQADILVLPDFSLKPNLKAMYEFTIKKLREGGIKSKFLACTFAGYKTQSDSVKHFKILNEIDDIDIIAVPYAFDKNLEYKRPELLDMIEKEIGVKNIKKQVHLFGVPCCENIKKEKREWISSMDSTLFFKCGVAEKGLPLNKWEEPKRSKTYFETSELNEHQRECIKYNLVWLKEQLE
jgi:hypothetical protein